MTKITQADREAAAKITGAAELRPILLNGTFDHHPYIEVFAAHRLAERERIVAWLPEQLPHLSLQEYADAIEQGAHDDE